MAITAYALQVSSHKDADTAYNLMNQLKTAGLKDSKYLFKSLKVNIKI